QFDAGGDVALSEHIRRHVRASAASASLRDPAATAWIHRGDANRALRDGDLVSYRDCLAASERGFVEAGEARHACSQRINGAYANVQLGALESAERLVLDALATAERLGLGQLSCRALHNLGVVVAWQGRHAEARTALERAVAGARDNEDRR